MRSDPKLILYPGLHIHEVNPAAAKVLGRTREQLVGMDLCSCVVNPEIVRSMYAAARRRGSAKEYVLELGTQQRPGSFLLCKASVLNANEEAAGETNDPKIMVTCRSLTCRKRSPLSHQERQERFRIAFEFASVGIGVVDLDGNFLEINQSLAHIFGFSKEQLEGMNLLDFWLPEERSDALADFRNAGNGGKAQTVFERRYRDREGKVLFAEVTRGLARNADGKPLYFIVSFRDITEVKRLQFLLEERASTDPLTGAMNRSGIEVRAQFEILRSDRYGDRLSLVMIDLDHFKAVNDTYGHLAGDRVLRGFCDIARSCLRSTDMLGRWGGEEFVALLPETELAGADLFAERLRMTLDAFHFEQEIHLSVSLGVAAHRVGEPFDALVARADAALYRAKRQGRNRVIVDREDLEREAAHEDHPSKLVQLQWSPSIGSGQKDIDEEHKELFRLANLLIAAITTGKDEKRVAPLVHDLLAHVEEHFQHEEKLLQRAEFPGAEAHGRIHRKLVERARQLTEQFEQGKGSAVELIGFLVHDFVARHMLVDDRKFFRWFQTRES